MKNGRLREKVAIVTGASKGIGAGIALAMGREGAAVAVNYSSNEAAARKVVGEVLAAEVRQSLFKAMSLARTMSLVCLLRRRRHSVHQTCW